MSSDLVLVTGTTGFVATHVVKQLLENGYRVRGTVRSLADEKTKNVQQIFADQKPEIELVEADLLNADSWSEAVKGVKYVIHVASPFPPVNPSDPDVLIKPAVDGTLAVLKAASEAGTVKRVVITSSIAAVYDACIPLPKEAEETKTLTEEHWTDGENPHLDAYARSKLLAEKAAWDFVKELPEEKKFELVTINPGLILGPLLMQQQSTSLELVKRLLDRSTPAIAKFNVAATDVRDVALAHVKALTVPEAAGHRHIIVTENVPMKEVALTLKKEFAAQGYHVPTFVAPNWVVWVSSLVDKSYKIVVPRLGRDFKYDNKRMREVLGITPTELSKSVIDSANSLIELGVVKKQKQKAKKAETVEGKNEEMKPANEAVNGAENKTEAEAH